MADTSDARARVKGEVSATPDRSIALLAFALVIMLILMVASIYYPYPNGKPLGFWGFVALWLREVLIVGFFLFALVAILWIRVWKRIGNRTEQNKNAP